MDIILIFDKKKVGKNDKPVCKISCSPSKHFG